MVFRGLIPLAIALSSCSHSPHAPRASPATEELSVANESGELRGTLQLPAGNPPFPVVVLIAGSGAVDRNGNQLPYLNTNTYALIAEGLATKGVASLRYDKRGVGGSLSALGRVEELTVEMEAADANRFAAALRGDRRFGKLVLAGHSEGALLAIIAAKAAPVDGLASIEGAGRPIGLILRKQLARKLSDALLAQAESIIRHLEAGQTVDVVPEELRGLFRASVQPYFISWMKYDPARELAKLRIPTLILQGTNDTQLEVTEAELLAAARPDARLVIVPGMSHPLKRAIPSADPQRTAYTDPSLPLAPEVVDELSALAR